MWLCETQKQMFAKYCADASRPRSRLNVATNVCRGGSRNLRYGGRGRRLPFTPQRLCIFRTLWRYKNCIINYYYFPSSSVLSPWLNSAMRSSVCCRCVSVPKHRSGRCLSPAVWRVSDAAAEELLRRTVSHRTVTCQCSSSTNTSSPRRLPSQQPVSLNDVVTYNVIGRFTLSGLYSKSSSNEIVPHVQHWNCTRLPNVL